MAKGPRYDIDIHFNSNINSIKEASQQLDKIRQKIARMEAAGVKTVAQKNMIDHMKKYEASLSRTLNKAREQTSHMIRGTVEYNETLQKTFKTFNANAAKALKIQEQLNAAIREQALLEQRAAAAEAKVVKEKEKKSLGGRTKRALSQSFVEAPLYSASFALMAGIGTSIQNFIELDKTLTRIGIVTGRNTESMKQFAHYAGEAGKALGVTGKAFADASLIFLQQGGAAADFADSLAQSSIKLANITGAQASDTSEYITAIANSFKLLEKEGSNAGAHITDMLASLDAASGSSADEIAQAFERSASSFASAGFSAEQASAMIATVSETTRQSAEMVGTGFKTMIGNLADIKAGAADTTEITSKLQKVSQEFGLTYSMIDQNTGNMKEVPQILKEVADLYNNSNDLAAKNALVEAIAGKEQRDRFIALITNQKRYNELLGVAQNSSGAADEANKRYLESAQAKIEAVKNEWEALTTKIMESDGFKNFLEELARLISQVNRSIDGFGDAMMGLAGIIIPLTIALKGKGWKQSAMESVAESSFGSSRYGRASRIGGARAAIGLARRDFSRSGGVKGVIGSGLSKAGGFAKSLGTGAGLKSAGVGLLKSAGRGLVSGGLLSAAFAVPEIMSALSSKDSGVDKFKSVLGSALPVVGAFFGPLGIGAGMLAKFALNASKSSKEVEALRDTIDKNKASFKEAFAKDKERVKGLISDVSNLPRGTEEYTKAANELAKIAPQLSLGQDEYGNAILDSTDAIRQYVEAVEKEIKADEKAARTKEAKSARKRSEAAVKGFSEAKTSTDKNTFLQGLSSSLKEELVAELGNMDDLTDEQKKFVRSGITKMISGKNAMYYFEELKANGVKNFFSNYQKDFIEEGQKGFKAQEAVAEIVSGNTKINWAETTFSSIVDDIASASNLTAEELKRGNYLQPIIDSLRYGFNDLNKAAKENRFSEIAKFLVPDSNIFNPSKFGSIVTNAKNSAGALATAMTLMLEAGRLADIIDESMDGGKITKGEFKAITRALKNSKNFKLSYGDLSGVDAAKAAREDMSSKTFDPSKIGVLAEKAAYKSISDSGTKFNYTTGSGSGDKKTASDFIQEVLDRYARARAINQGKLDAADSTLSMSDASKDNWISSQEAVITGNRLMLAQAETERRALMALADRNSVVKKSAEYQEALNKIDQEAAGINKKLLESIQKLASDKGYISLYGTADLDAIKEKYQLRKDILDNTLNSYEKIVEKSALDLDIQSEILNTTDKVYQSNLKLFEQRLKTVKLNKTSLDILKTELDLLKKLKEQTSGGMRLTRVGPGEFRYIKTAQSAEQKAAALSAAQSTEAEVSSKYYEASQKQFDLNNQVILLESQLQTLLKTDPRMNKKETKDLKAKLDQAKKASSIAAESTSEYATAQTRAKTVTGLIQSGKEDIATQLLANGLSIEKAMSYLPKDMQKAITEASNETISGGISTEGLELIKSNDKLIDGQSLLTKSTDKLNETIKGIKNTIPSSIGIKESDMRALSNILNPTNNKKTADDSPSGPKTKEDPKKKTTKDPAKDKKVSDFNASQSAKNYLSNKDKDDKKIIGMLTSNISNKSARSFAKDLGINKNLFKANETAEEAYKRIGLRDPSKQTKEEKEFMKEYSKNKNSEPMNKLYALQQIVIRVGEEVDELRAKYNRAKKAVSEEEKRLKSKYGSIENIPNTDLENLKKLKKKRDSLKSQLDVPLKDYSSFKEEYNNYMDNFGGSAFSSNIKTEHGWKNIVFTKFDTGGYTGEFNGGKVAMLHQKELVLNKIDTENMLKAVQIVREIPQLAANIPNMSGTNSNSNNQNISINASFPNVSSSEEIKKAFESMSTKALQYAYRTKSY